MTIIGILGQKRNGKDTIADYLVSNNNYEKKAFAEPIKELCKVLFNYSDDQLHGESKEEEDEYWKITPRETFQFVGTEFGRNLLPKYLPWVGENFWVLKLMKYCQNNSNKNICIPDVRRQNEAAAIKENGGFIIKVVKPDIKSNDNHISETEVDEIPYDYLIINDGSLEELYQKIKDISFVE
jgi:hypothetical protein